MREKLVQETMQISTSAGRGGWSSWCARAHTPENLVGALELGGGHDHLGELGVQRELGHDGAHLRQVALVVQGPQVVEHLQSAHEGLGGRRVHEVKVDLGGARGGGWGGGCWRLGGKGGCQDGCAKVKE